MFVDFILSHQAGGDKKVVLGLIDVVFLAVKFDLRVFDADTDFSEQLFAFRGGELYVGGGDELSVGEVFAESGGIVPLLRFPTVEIMVDVVLPIREFHARFPGSVFFLDIEIQLMGGEQRTASGYGFVDRVAVQKVVGGTMSPDFGDGAADGEG